MVLVLHIQSYHLYSTGQPSPSKGSQNAPSLTPRVLFDLFEKSLGHLESHRHPCIYLDQGFSSLTPNY